MPTSKRARSRARPIKTPACERSEVDRLLGPLKIDVEKIKAALRKVRKLPDGLDPADFTDSRTARVVLGGVSTATLKFWVDAGKINPVKLSPKRFLYPWADIFALQESRRKR
ncbi:MAG TPA: hypothetical protein VGH23_16465 [Rhizomicrobium sp.]